MLLWTAQNCKIYLGAASHNANVERGFFFTDEKLMDEEKGQVDCWYNERYSDYSGQLPSNIFYWLKLFEIQQRTVMNIRSTGKEALEHQISYTEGEEELEDID